MRRRLLLLLLLLGAGAMVAGVRRYAAAWSGAGSDPAGVKAASGAAMHALPMAALGVLLATAAAIGLWRDR